MVRAITGVVALVPIPVEFSRGIVTMMMIVLVFSCAAQTTVFLHFHRLQTAALTHIQVRKELLQNSAIQFLLSSQFDF